MRTQLYHWLIAVFVSCLIQEGCPYTISFLPTVPVAYSVGLCHKLPLINVCITRCRPSKGRRCIPDVDMEVHVETFLNVDLSSSAQVKIQVKFNFELFWRKNQIFGSPWCSTREDLSIDVSITDVGLILTKLRWFQLFVKSQISNFKLFWKKLKFSGFHCVVLVKTFPLMHQLLM